MVNETADFIKTPEYGISVQPDNNGKLWMGLEVYTEQSRHTFYLCRPGEHEQVARQIAQQITKAGVEARRAESGLVVANGSDVDAVVSQAQGRKQQR